MSGVNVATALVESARRTPDADALVLTDGRRVTYAELEADARRIAAGLQRVGAGRGVRTVLAVPPGPDFFPLVFGMFLAGTIPVVVDPGMGLRAAGRCLEQAEPEAFVGSGKATAARLLTGLGGKSVRTRIIAGSSFGWGGLTLDRVRKEGDRAGDGDLDPAGGDDPAAILFTSGSTGPPKGVVCTHAMLHAQVGMVRALTGVEPGAVDLPTFPLFALFDPALGMTTVVPDMDPSRPAAADPARLVAQIRDHGVNCMFGSPGLLAPLTDHLEATGTRLDGLARVISAGAPVPAPLLGRLRPHLAAGARLHTPYGATEALPVACIEAGEILADTAARTAEGAGTCVGRPVEGVDVAILRIDDGPIAVWSDDLHAAAGEWGEVVVRGPQVTRSYWARPDADAAAKIADPGGGVRHRMGDLGRFDAEGRLWFGGRKGQRVRTAAGDLPTAVAEGVAAAVDGVRRAALVGTGPAGAQEPVVCVETDGGDAVLEAVRSRLAAVEATRGVTRVVRHPGLPVDTRHNAKIRREEVAAWAASRADG